MSAYSVQCGLANTLKATVHWGSHRLGDRSNSSKTDVKTDTATDLSDTSAVYFHCQVSSTCHRAMISILAIQYVYLQLFHDILENYCREAKRTRECNFFFHKAFAVFLERLTRLSKLYKHYFIFIDILFRPWNDLSFNLFFYIYWKEQTNLISSSHSGSSKIYFPKLLLEVAKREWKMVGNTEEITVEINTVIYRVGIRACLVFIPNYA